MDLTKIFTFGGELPQGTKYAAALVFVLILILFVSWLLKKITAKVRIGGRRGGRLKVQESIMVDANRVLTLIRCDNVEHLILLGGTNDLVVASDIQKPPSTVKNSPLTVALAPTVQTPAPQPMAPGALQAAPPPPHTGTPTYQEPPAQASQPAPAAPHIPPQQPANPMPNVPHPTHYKPPQQPTQPLPTPAPRTTIPAAQQPHVSTPPKRDAPLVSQPSQTDTDQMNAGNAENLNSPSLSNIRPGDEK